MFILFALLSSLPITAPAGPDQPEAFALPRDEAQRLASGEGDAHRFVPGRGLEFKSKDGRFALAMSLRFGFIYTLKRDEAAAPEARQHFEIRRFRTVFHGNLFGPKNRYFLQLAFGPRELDLRDGVIRGTPVYDAYLQFEQLRDLNLRVGQYRVMYTRERNIADVNPLLIDRSRTNNEFNLDRDIGLDLRSEDLGGLKRLHYYAGVFLGEGPGATQPGDGGLLYVSRVDVLPLGLFDDYEAADLWRLKRLRLSVGGAYAYQDRARKDRGVLGSEPADGGTTNFHNFTTDLMLKYAGWTLDAAYMWRHGHRNPGERRDETGAQIPIELARTGHGWLLQTSLLIPHTRLEPALRYSGTRGLGRTSMPDRDEVGGGLNYYFFGHNLKLQLDYFHTRDPHRSAPASDTLRIQIQAAL